jgi:WD40 repeat protein
VTCARIGGKDVLISGGADSKIITYDIASGEKLQVLKDHLRGVQDLRIDPIILDQSQQTIKLFSAGSEREIREYTLGVSTANVEEPLIVHETSVYKLYFDEDGDLWTASADKSAKCLTRDSGWTPNLTLEHPDFVRDVVVFEQGGWVITACRDEEVRVWNKAVCFGLSTSDLLSANLNRRALFTIPSPGISRR